MEGYYKRIKPVFLVPSVLTQFPTKHFLLLVSRWIIVVILSCLGNTDTHSLLCLVSLNVFSLRISRLCWLWCVSALRSSRERAVAFKLCSVLINISKVKLKERKFNSVNLTVIATNHRVHSPFGIWMSSSADLSFYTLSHNSRVTSAHTVTSLWNQHNQSACLLTFPESWQS